MREPGVATVARRGAGLTVNGRVAQWSMWLALMVLPIETAQAAPPRQRAHLTKRPREQTARKRTRKQTARKPGKQAVPSHNVDSEVVTDGATRVKVMRFGGLDVQGRLRSPQLMYFENRVRAEFERPRLPHRSFMPELDLSTHREPL